VEGANFASISQIEKPRGALLSFCQSFLLSIHALVSFCAPFFVMHPSWRIAICTFLGLVSITSVHAEAPLDPAFKNAIEERQACNDDDLLLSFQRGGQDVVSYCSSLLSIQDYTETADPVTLTT